MFVFVQQLLFNAMSRTNESIERHIMFNYLIIKPYESSIINQLLPTVLTVSATKSRHSKTVVINASI